MKSVVMFVAGLAGLVDGRTFGSRLARQASFKTFAAAPAKKMSTFRSAKDMVVTAGTVGAFALPMAAGAAGYMSYVDSLPKEQRDNQINRIYASCGVIPPDHLDKKDKRSTYDGDIVEPQLGKALVGHYSDCCAKNSVPFDQARRDSKMMKDKVGASKQDGNDVNISERATEIMTRAANFPK